MPYSSERLSDPLCVVRERRFVTLMAEKRLMVARVRTTTTAVCWWSRKDGRQTEISASFRVLFLFLPNVLGCADFERTFWRVDLE